MGTPTQYLCDYWSGWVRLPRFVCGPALILVLQLVGPLDHTTQMAIDYSTVGRVGRLSAKEAWETIEDLAQYEDEEWYHLIFPEKGNLDYIDATSE
ncbi:hypothetical protein Tco_0716484 [Tanacetum coccineum]